VRFHLGESADAVLEICTLALDLESSDVVFVVVDEVAKLRAYGATRQCNLSCWQKGQCVCEEFFRNGQ
jgi:hypothetical protein